jgi:hypothetical protein
MINMTNNLEFMYCDDRTKIDIDRILILICGKLNDSEISRIRKNRILIITSRVLSSTLSNIFFTDTKRYHLVSIDNELCKYFNFSVDEIAAILMHEFGHILNEPSKENIKLIEEYADAYACSNGFRNSLKNSLEKYLDKAFYLNDEQKNKINDRIEFINKNQHHTLIGHEKILRN